MRVGMVVPGGVDRSGTHRIIPELVDRLEALGRIHDLHVVALRQEPKPGDWSLPGAHVHNVGARPRRIRALGHLVREHGRRPFDLLHAFALVPQGPVVAAAARALSLPWVVEAPGGEFADHPEIGFGGWRRWQGRAAVRVALRGAAACAVPSRGAASLAATRGARAVRVPLAISTLRWPAAPPAPPSPPARLVWVGSLNEVKDPWLLVEVVRLLASRRGGLHVDVVGEDLLEGRVRRRVVDAGLEPHVAFRGFLTQDRLRDVLTGAAVLLVTSRFDAGLRVVLEAATLGVPTVGTRVGYVEEWSPDAAVAVGSDPAALAEAVGTLLDDPERRLRLAAAAQARMGEHAAEAVAERWDELYRAALAGGRPGG